MDKWKEIFNKNLPCLDEEKKEQSIQKLKVYIANTDIIVKEGYFAKIKRYIPFVNKFTLLFQFILLLIGILTIKTMTFEKTRFILSLVMPILAFLQMMELERSFNYHMYEIEMSCKTSLKELISIKLLITTCINLCIITGLASLVGAHFNCESYTFIIYFLVPFVMTNSLNLGLIRLFKNKSNEVINVSTMFLINIILIILHMKFPWVYEMSSIFIWLGLLWITVFYWIKEFFNFYKEEEGDIWNLQSID